MVLRLRGGARTGVCGFSELQVAAGLAGFRKSRCFEFAFYFAER